MARDKVSVHNVSDGSCQVLTFTQAREFIRSLKPTQSIASCMRDIRDEQTVEIGVYRLELLAAYLQ